MNWDTSALDAAYRATVPWARPDMCRATSYVTFSYHTKERAEMEKDLENYVAPAAPVDAEAA